MHERPADIEDREVEAILRREWQLPVRELRHLPVGFGGYHWLAVSGAGSQWFVTVNDVSDERFAELAAAMETAAWLASRARLDFVVAPVRTTAGCAAGRLASRYAVMLFPFADCVPGSFGDRMDSRERAAVIEMLAALHSVPADGPRHAPMRPLEPTSRVAIHQALDDLGQRWRGGPFAEPGRRLLASHEPTLLDSLARFDALVAGVRKAGRPLVITHGEPHPGNLLRGRSRWLLVDWDTVGLAPAERDLWWVLQDLGEDAAAYTARTGRAVSAEALDLYRLRWALDDIGLFLAEIRAPHKRTADTEKVWAGLRSTLERLPTG